MDKLQIPREALMQKHTSLLPLWKEAATHGKHWWSKQASAGQGEEADSTVKGTSQTLSWPQLHTGSISISRIAKPIQHGMEGKEMDTILPLMHLILPDPAGSSQASGWLEYKASAPGVRWLCVNLNVFFFFLTKSVSCLHVCIDKLEHWELEGWNQRKQIKRPQDTWNQAHLPPAMSNEINTPSTLSAQTLLLGMILCSGADIDMLLQSHKK